MKRHLLAALLCAFTTFVLAQTGVLKGRVTDANDGTSIPGANVSASGKVVVTDASGNYTVELPAGDHSVSFSFVGYTTRTETIKLPAGEERTLNVKLASSAAQLDMVVVSAGRFEQRVGEVTQSLSVLRPDLIRNKNIMSMDQALDQVPGVVVVDEEPQIRAGSGFSYGAGSRVQVCVDDIPILSGWMVNAFEGLAIAFALQRLGTDLRFERRRVRGVVELALVAIPCTVASGFLGALSTLLV
ncbi:MAG TPA: carboxypeptidase-like regulatory domain-containing protein, partial [Flavobacteriales bacterium]|nr:carboxypeptidase-like regulatory domain-containing protein [Flavobacteriales bacterium]